MDLAPPPAPPAPSAPPPTLVDPASASAPPLHPPNPHQSHAAHHTAPQLDPEQLDAELPTVLQDLVPLSYLIDRVVAAAYADLANLVETLPSQNDQARKRAIVDYVLHTRRQLLKLLVLTRWSTEADRIQKAMNIVGFLAMQNHAVESSITALTDTTSMLSGARVRNYDLATALSVLTTGTYPSLPSALRERFTSGAAPLSDDAVVQTLRDVDAVLRWRLVMRLEPVPAPMARVPWRIGDGRVVFAVPGLWEATLTYGGGMEDEEEGQEGGEWFLLGVRFLFRVKDARGSWNATPAGPLKEHLVDLCNRELLRRPYFPPPDQPEGAPAEGEEQKADAAQEVESAEVREARRADDRAELVRKRRRDRPLDRAYTFLQRLALSYQLEAVYASAARLAATSWNGSLRVEMSAERDEVRVEYWTYKPDPLPNQQGQRTPAPPASGARPSPGGALVISLRPPAASPTGGSTAPPPAAAAAAASARTAAREHALQAALAAATSSPSPAAAPPSSSVDPAPAPPAVPPAALRVSWLPPPSYASSAAALSPALELGEELDVEALLERVTRAHAREVVRRLGEVVGEVEGGVEVRCPLREGQDGMVLDEAEAEEEEDDEEEDTVPFLRIPLLGAQALEAHVLPRTGRFELRDASGGEGEGEEGGGARAARLRAATERVDRERFAPPPPPPGVGQKQEQDGESWMRGVAEVVARIRASTILDDLDTLLSLLALPLAGPSARRLPLPARELAKLGPNPALAQGRAALLFVPLLVPSTSGEKWALAFVLFEEGVRAALLRARETSDGMNSFWELGEVGWLGRAGEDAKGKGREDAPAAGGRGANLGYEVGGETVRGLWAQCVHRVALFELEQQLSSRRIPYRLAPPASPADELLLPAAPARTCLLVQAAALVRLPDAERVVGKEAALQCVVDAEGRIRTTLHIRFRLPLPSSALPDPADLPPHVLWNPKRGVMVFALEDDLDGAVERLLRAYAAAVRTILAAQRAAAAASASATSASAAALPPSSPSKKLNGAPPPVHARGLPNGVGV
ncbi:mediator complex subunit [Rhodotorula kratochvilovae]